MKLKWNEKWNKNEMENEIRMKWNWIKKKNEMEFFTFLFLHVTYAMRSLLR